jgi:hypothetical protein
LRRGRQTSRRVLGEEPARAMDVNVPRRASWVSRRLVELRAGRISVASWTPTIGELLPRAGDAFGVREKLSAYRLNPDHELEARGFLQILGVRGLRGRHDRMVAVTTSWELRTRPAALGHRVHRRRLTAQRALTTAEVPQLRAIWTDAQRGGPG